MSKVLEQIDIDQWDRRHAELRADGVSAPAYDGPLSRHIADGDLRLLKLKYDNSAAALDLWNLLLTEEERLQEARSAGKYLVGAMKDLGTVPVMAYSLSNVIAFYPDGAWWIPCVMELNAGLLGIADSLGIDDSFCPVRAMLGAFVSEAHFPIPDLLVCSVGATCDDFSAIAQRLNGLGFPVLWWEAPHRRRPEQGEDGVHLPGGFEAPEEQVEFVKSELRRVADAMESLAGGKLDDTALSVGIMEANRVRRCLAELRCMVFDAEVCPLPALELLVAEMMTLHFCSNRNEALRVLSGLLTEVRARVKEGSGFFGREAVRVFWVNPVADLRVMNMLEECGGRICGTEYLFTHALDEIPEDIPPMDALSRMALADPMVGPAADRAGRICRDARRFKAEAVVVSRIPGASHCAWEGRIIVEAVRDQLGIPVLEMEVPPVSDPMQAGLKTRLGALVEAVRSQRVRS
jgi:benzoyl-CoA reductase/2-hydroxyglutaryl-CoA dehydratase subunit BcrC/BadD/HgdB